MPPLESFKPLKSMVFAGIYPLEHGGFLKLEESVRRVSFSFLILPIHKFSRSNRH